MEVRGERKKVEMEIARDFPRYWIPRMWAGVHFYFDAISIKGRLIWPSFLDICRWSLFLTTEGMNFYVLNSHVFFTNNSSQE